MAHRQDGGSGSINRRDASTLLADYAGWLAEQPVSSRTREVYLAAVTAFVVWLEQRDAGPGEALVAPRARDLAARDYKRHMKVQRGLSPASVNQALAGMDNLFHFLGLGAAIVRREELPRSAPRALDDEQRLLQAAEESTPRDRAIVALLLFTGLRLSEAASLQIADVRISARKGLVVVRSGKGDAYREVELNALVRAMLDEWVDARKKIAAQGESSFFVSRTGSALSSRSIDLAVRRLAGRARLELSAHVLRHTFVTALVRAGNDVVLVAELAGHRRLETTRRYSPPSKAERRKPATMTKRLPTDDDTAPLSGRAGRQVSQPISTDGIRPKSAASHTPGPDGLLA